MTYEPSKIANEFMLKGLFSEYLPPNFNLDCDNINIFDDIPISQKTDYVEPYGYTMSRFTDNNKRRIIHLPEFASYLSTVRYMRDKNIIKELVDISNQGYNSFSKLMQSDGTLTKHECSYDSNSIAGINDSNDEFAKSTYITNVVEKINRAKGAIGVLCLDISNFYGSIYTHLLPAIVLGYEEAIRQYKLSLGNMQDEQITEQYKKYKDLDVKVRSLNAGRTNGLLTGTLISQFLAEALLTRIDIEIWEKDINFVRYTDNYEVFIYNEDDIEKVESEITTIIAKYHFSFNNEKTQYTPFPYYAIENLEKIYEKYASSEVDTTEIIELFNRYFRLEKDGTKGAIRYLIKSIDKKLVIKDHTLYASFLLNVLVNDNRSLVKVCELIIRDKSKLNFDKGHIEVICNLLAQCIEKNKDLEVIWLVYLLKKMGVAKPKDKIIEKIIQGKNDLAKVIVIHEYESLLTDKEKAKCVETAQSWLLLYQLFFKDYITKEDFRSKSGIKNNVDVYARLKRTKFSFYK